MQTQTKKSVPKEWHVSGHSKNLEGIYFEESYYLLNKYRLYDEITCYFKCDRELTWYKKKIRQQYFFFDIVRDLCLLYIKIALNVSLSECL